LKRAAVIFVLLIALAAAAATSHQPARAARPDAALAQAGGPKELAVIVNKSNPNDNLSLAELREYFLAERGNWPNGQGKVRVVMLEAGNPERDAALRLIYDMNEKGFTSYFLGKKFRGETIDEPRQQGSPPDVIKFISYVPGAIGYVAAGEVDASVKVMRVDGLAPGDPGYKLKL
jgi:ABC-type phosphate transport system substrate-binding protein